MTFFIPRTNRLANVAAKKPIAKLRTERGRRIAFRFDRPVGDALARVERAIRSERLSRAALHTAIASAAVIGDLRLAGRDVERGVDLPNE